MGMGCTTVAVRMLRVCSYVSSAAGIKGLHLHKSEGAWTIKALKGKVRDVGQRSTLSLHESLHALILAAARPAEEVPVICHQTLRQATSPSWL